MVGMGYVKQKKTDKAEFYLQLGLKISKEETFDNHKLIVKGCYWLARNYMVLK